MPSPIQIVLLPLDERPVNTRYPQVIGAIGGTDVCLPPAAIQGLQRTPADRDALTAWLRANATEAVTAALVSCDYLGYGNLINARISDESAITVLDRLRLLPEVNARCPVHAFSLITRVSNADNSVEEPLYWEQWGTTFYRFARLTHQAEQGTLDRAEQEELDVLGKSLPADLRADWLTRRLRNHTVNLALMDLAARDQIASLLLTSDDTSAYGFPSRERDWLRGWPELIGPTLGDRVMMHPGADEVGSALVAKTINRQEGLTPRVWIDYAVPDGEEIIAPYEDRPVRETVLGQIHACGCRVADSPDESDFVLGVATPSPRRTEFRAEFQADERAARGGDYRQFLARLSASQQSGRPVALGDVAYPNGSDPLLLEMLLDPSCPLEPGKLAAYGAWNTAGNTLGVVIAQASCALRMGGHPEREFAQRLFLAHRFVEDYGYQLLVRREARENAQARWGHGEPDPDNADELRATSAFIEHRLRDMLAQLQARGIGVGLHLAPGSVRLPWRRTFEVDFDLAPE